MDPEDDDDDEGMRKSQGDHVIIFFVEHLVQESHEFFLEVIFVLELNCGCNHMWIGPIQELLGIGIIYSYFSHSHDICIG